jgi:glutaredoxin 3
MPDVEIYTTFFCPYCLRAKNLLQSKGVAYREFDVELDPGLRDEMASRATGRTTVPQIFIDDRHIGGCDDLYALEAKGALDRLLGLLG